jgi:hypothetical protein
MTAHGWFSMGNKRRALLAVRAARNLKPAIDELPEELPFDGRVVGSLTLARAVELYESGASTLKIAEMAGVARSTVDVAFRRANVSRRPKRPHGKVATLIRLIDAGATVEAAAKQARLFRPHSIRAAIARWRPDLIGKVQG